MLLNFPLQLLFKGANYDLLFSKFSEVLRLASWTKSPVQIKTARILSGPLLCDCLKGHIAALAYPPYPARQVGVS